MLSVRKVSPAPKYFFFSTFSKRLSFFRLFYHFFFFKTCLFLPTRPLNGFFPIFSKYVRLASRFRWAPIYSPLFRPVQKNLLASFFEQFYLSQPSRLTSYCQVLSYKIPFNVDKHNYSQMLERDSGSWSSIRRKLRLPTRGQRTKTNSRTSKKGHRSPFISALLILFGRRLCYLLLFLVNFSWVNHCHTAWC